MSDLISRLRTDTNIYIDSDGCISGLVEVQVVMCEAADEVERLTAERNEAREAAKWIMYDYEPHDADWAIERWPWLEEEASDE